MSDDSDDLDIAVIGLAGRFPSARNVDELWRNLRSGIESVRPLAAEESSRADSFETDGTNYVRNASTLADVELFDAPFFGYSPREASLIDPQARLFLECAWEALEHAGYNPQKTGVGVGVYAGQSLSTYLLGHVYGELALDDFALSGGNIQAIIGNAGDFLPTRVSYKLNLSGPSVNVQTACSSSLVAIHLARQALLAGECEMALAGGASIYLPQNVGYHYQEGMILSPDGRCRPFDAAARGTIFGRGVGVVVLKPLANALRDGDDIHAVIKGSAINNDGAAKVGFTAPGVDAQARVIAEALANAGADADSISYVETHGTGTPQGDPIEIAALTRAFRLTTSRNQYCAIGSIKGNIGHLDVAAGVTGLIKTVLMLRHRERPASLHFSQPSPQINFADSPFYVNARLDDWPAAAPRRAGVSSFGMGGTNAHVILEEAPTPRAEERVAERPVGLLTLSAKTERALNDLALAASKWFATHGASDLHAACRTSNVGRAHFAHRFALTARSPEDAAATLARFAAGELHSGSVGHAANRRPRVVFLFTGQGSQYSGMGQKLYATEPVFRQVLDRCASLLQPELGMSLLDLMFDPRHAALLGQTSHTQPALFALEYALAELWRSWGVEPDLLIGHSLGENVAACVAGVVSLEDGLRLIAGRARLMQALPRDGDMIAIFAPRERVAAAIAAARGHVSIAAYNAPENVVISGERSAVAAVANDFREQGFEVRALATSHAFHSALMEPVLDSYEQLARGVQYRPARIPIISNVTAKEADDDLLSDPNYWRTHIREPVRFADSIAHIGLRSGDVLLEIGPSPVLISLARQCRDEPGVRWLPSLRKGTQDSEQILDSLGALYAAGIDPAWDSFHRDRPKRRIAFPTYPFQRERHWIERTTRSRRARSDGAASQPRDRLIARRVSSPALTEQVFESDVGSSILPYVADHCIAAAVVFPATGFLELAFEAAEALRVESPSVASMSIDRALICTDRDLVLQTIVAAEADGRRPFRIFARRAGDADRWTLHAAGELVRGNPAVVAAATDIEEARLRCRNYLTGSEYYARLRAKGFGYGPAFQGIKSIWWNDGEAVAELGVPAAVGALGGYRAHPAVLDAGLQAVLAAAGQLDADHLHVPSSFERVTVSGGLADIAWVRVRLRSEAAHRSADVDISDARGRVIVAVRGVRIVRASPAAFHESRVDAGAEPVYEIKWEPKPLPPFRAPGSNAAFLPAPATIERRLDAALDAVRERHGLATYDSLLPEIDRLCARYAANALVDLGWTPTPGEQLSTDELSNRLKVLPKYRRMLVRSLDMLAEDGFLERKRDEWRVVRPFETGDLSQEAERLRRAYPSCAVELQLTDRCGMQLGGVLCGRVEPLHLLFPGGSTSDLEQLYRDAPFTRAYNTIVRDAVSLALERLPPQRKLRVLEIGAGTGGTSSLVLPVLPADRTEYVFSDASNLFMMRAKTRFAEFPFVSYQLLDIEQNPLAQGYEPGDFDLVLATNVLHATSDALRTLKYVRDLLAPEGMLVMVEGISRQRWVDMIFGLTDGWWKATDSDRADGYPLMSRAQWRQALTDAGFESPLSVPSEGRAPIFEQAVMFARTPQAAIARSVSTHRAEDVAVIGDPAGFGGAVRTQLEVRGARVRIIDANTDASTVESRVAEWLADAQATAESAEPPSRRTLIHCVGADSAPEVSSPDALRAAVERQGASLLHVVKAMARASEAPAKLCIVTRASHAIEPGDGAANTAGATLWGMANVVALEHPELACTRVDIGPNEPALEAADRVVLELGVSDDREDQVSWRGDRRYVARLAPLPIERSPPQAAGAAPVVLQIAERGTLDRLAVTPTARRSPGPGEIEIRVRAAGVNFKDVLNALGTYPGDPGPLGLECAGTVVGVGEGVAGFAVGDDVIAIAPGCFGTFVVAPAALAVPAPAGLAPEAAASFPAAFVTAYHALHELARVKTSDRVLIHAAAGGVGMAALQIALRAGAEVFATAGTAEKRALVRRMGAAHVFDSRIADFPDEILKITQGKGVDVVLNSLAGEFIDGSFRVLSVGGRFVELGKNGIWDPSRVAALNRNIDYRIVDVQALAAENAERVGATLKTTAALIAAGELRPLPIRSFPLSDAVAAFRFVAQAKHVGKVVLRMDDRANDVVRSDATYLITGGFGGLGLLFAEWLVSRGARHIALMGRRDPDAGARAAIAALEQRGAAVTLIIGDVGKFEDVEHAVATIRATMPGLRGVLHAAGTLDDGALAQQRWDRFERVMQAKVHGAWNLDRLTEGVALDWFVMFSSLAAMLGSRGQANHAAANAFMDALAYQRRARGLPALSINWGAWSRLGAAAADAVLKRLAGIGIGALSPEDGVALFDALLSRAVAGGGPAQVGVLPVDWPRYVREACGGRAPPLLSALDAVRFEAQPQAGASAAAARPDGHAEPLTTRLAAARPGERHDLLLSYLKDHVVQSLGLDARRALDLRQPLSELGLDSLMAVELRTRISRGLGMARSLPATLLFDYPTIADLADYLRKELFPDTPPVHAAVRREAEQRDAVADLTEEEAEARLLEELSGQA